MEVDLKTLLRGNHEFAQTLYRIISTDKRTTLLSPISIHSVLTLLSQDPYLFCNKQILSLLLSIDVNTATTCYKHVLALLNSIDNRSFSLTNKVFLKNHLELEELFRTRLLTDFLYELIQSLNFDRSDAVVELINKWIGEKTCNKAKDLINSGDVTDKTYLTLLNSTYFNDKWAKPFTECIPATFHVNNSDTVRVEMMKITSEFYYKDDIFNAHKVLQLPFVNNDLSLIVILPNIGSKFGMFEFYGHDVTSFTDNMRLQEVNVSLPKFKIEETLELNKFLKEMGLESILSANFNSVISDEEINLNKLQQKVFIDINQDGSEAASGTTDSRRNFLQSQCDSDVNVPFTVQTRIK